MALGIEGRWYAVEAVLQAPPGALLCWLMTGDDSGLPRPLVRRLQEAMERQADPTRCPRG